MHQHFLFANEIRLEVGDGEIVGPLGFARVVDARDEKASAVFRLRGHAGLEIFGFDPASTGDPPWMFFGRPDGGFIAVMSAKRNLPDDAFMERDGMHDRLQRDRAGFFVPGPDLVADLDLFNRLQAVFG